jgi:hypothetical protein
VPPGNYRLRLWHPGLPLNTEPAPIAVTVTTTDLEQRAQLAVSAEP